MTYSDLRYDRPGWASRKVDEVAGRKYQPDRRVADDPVRSSVNGSKAGSTIDSRAFATPDDTPRPPLPPIPGEATRAVGTPPILPRIRLLRLPSTEG